MNLTKSKILILGAGGVTGKAMIHLLRNFTDTIYIYDQNKEIEFEQDLINLSHYDFEDKEEIQSLLKKHSWDYCFITPGFPRKSTIAKTLEENSIPVIGELDLGYYYIFHIKKRSPFVIAITGTDGKSTTTNLTAELFRSQNINAKECGNYGIPLSEIANSPDQEIPEVLVVECSSYQLELLYYFKPDISMILNIAEDHMDRYDSFKDYLKAKLNIVSFVDFSHILLTTEEVIKEIYKFNLNSCLQNKSVDVIDTQWLFKEGYCFINTQFYWKDFKVNNLNNRMNFLFSIKALELFLAAKKMEPDIKKLQEVFKNYNGLPYRLQFVKQIKNITFINDSKATTVQAVISAIKNFKDDSILLLLGGLDKNLNFQKILQLDVYKKK